MADVIPFELTGTALPPLEIANILESGSNSIDDYLGNQIYSNHDPSYLEPVRARLAATARAHAQNVGNKPAFLLRAPGRLNAFLEYLDMCAGAHMSTTIDGDMIACVTVREDSVVRTFNPNPEFAPSRFDIKAEMNLFRSAPWDGVLCAGLEDNWDNRTRIHPHYGHIRGDWMNFIRSPFLRVACEAPGIALAGVDMTFGESTIPLRGGTSSSSALVVLSFLALWLANSSKLPAWDIKYICRLLGEAEWYVGTHGGANDQTTILRNQPNCVLYNRHSQPVPDSTVLPSLRGVRMIVANSLWEANKTLGANHIFNLRKGWMDLGDDLMKLIITHVTSHLQAGNNTSPGWLNTLLADRMNLTIPSANLLNHNPELWQKIKDNYRQFGSLHESILQIPDEAVDELTALLPAEISIEQAASILGKDESALERDYTIPYPEEGGYRPRSAAIFFLKENRIGRELEKLFIEAESRLSSGEIALDSNEYRAYQEKVGKILDDLQTTIRDDFQVSNYQLDLLLDIARHGPGYLGGKLTGAGGGGCVVIMVREGEEQAMCRYLDEEYYQKPENFQVYRKKISTLPPDIASGILANLESALSDIPSQRRPVTFSRGAGIVDLHQ